MSSSGKAIKFFCKNIHLDSGELAAGEVTCARAQPMEVTLGARTSDSIKLPDTAHIALGRFDPHVHFRESAEPTEEEVERYGPAETNYESLLSAVLSANSLYSIRSGCLAALKGGVSVVGAMGNTPWGPVGPYRHRRTQEHYDAEGLIPIVVWPRMEPGAEAVKGHEGKDFGSTFGGSGLSGQVRADMYALWQGEAVSYHNDQPRSGESIVAFKERVDPPLHQLHHAYFDGATVLLCQENTMDLAESAGVSSLLARHIPTGAALQQILDRSRTASCDLPAEIGLDYMYWCRERLDQQPRELALLNYRRPAHPTLADREALIDLVRKTVRADYEIFFGSDHAPHPLTAKQFKSGLPGSPGTRNLEHSLQYYLELVRKHDYTWSDIDRLAAINPARHMAKFVKFPFPTGTMETGAMANLAIFDPEAAYRVDEAHLQQTLDDPHYHSALAAETGLRGKSLFTVSNGVAWEVKYTIEALN